MLLTVTATTESLAGSITKDDSGAGRLAPAGPYVLSGRPQKDITPWSAGQDRKVNSFGDGAIPIDDDGGIDHAGQKPERELTTPYVPVFRC